MSRSPMFEYIGDPVCMMASTSSSDGAAASDNANGVPILGYDGILFLEVMGVIDATDVSQWQIQYSSTGTASDAVTSNAGMTCTDAIFAAHDTDTVAGDVSILDFSIKAKGMADAAGKFYVSHAAAETGAAITCIVGIPYGGSTIYPATNAATAIHADDQV